MFFQNMCRQKNFLGKKYPLQKISLTKKSHSKNIPSKNFPCKKHPLILVQKYPFQKIFHPKNIPCKKCPETKYPLVNFFKQLENCRGKFQEIFFTSDIFIKRYFCQEYFFAKPYFFQEIFFNGIFLAREIFTKTFFTRIFSIKPQFLDNLKSHPPHLRSHKEETLEKAALPLISNTRAAEHKPQHQLNCYECKYGHLDC